MRLINWWKKLTMNEKLMYALLLALTIGIATRWRFVLAEVSEAFGNRFGS